MSEDGSADNGAAVVTTRRIRVDIPEFDPSDINGWIERTENCFDFEGIVAEREKVIAVAHEWMKKKRKVKIAMKIDGEYVPLNDIWTAMRTAFGKTKRDRDDAYDEMPPRGSQSMTDFLHDLNDILENDDDQLVKIRKTLELNTPEDVKAAVAREVTNSAYAACADEAIRVLKNKKMTMMETAMATTSTPPLASAAVSASANWPTCYICGEEGHVAIGCRKNKNAFKTPVMPAPRFYTPRPGFANTNTAQRGGFLPNFYQPPRNNIFCYKCKKAGHLPRDCWSGVPMRGRGRGRFNQVNAIGYYPPQYPEDHTGAYFQNYNQSLNG